jgi:hypothetical protein
MTCVGLLSCSSGLSLDDLRWSPVVLLYSTPIDLVELT